MLKLGEKMCFLSGKYFPMENDISHKMEKLSMREGLF